jgi:hypothetical protein
MNKPELVERVALEDWQKPYRTMDASGSPTDAGVVGWNWIGELAQQERANDAALLVIQDTPVEGGGKIVRLYRSTTLLAVAATFRDDMNYTVLVRWKAPEDATAAIEELGVERLVAALGEQTLLVDRLCTAVDQAAHDIGHESIDDLLRLIGPANEHCIEVLGGREALSSLSKGRG